MRYFERCAGEEIRRLFHVPLLWRWSVTLCIAFAALIGGALVIVRASPPDLSSCLRFTDGIFDNGLIDLHTGATIGAYAQQRPVRLEIAKMRLFGTLYQAQESPNGSYVAYSAYDAGLARLRLYVKTTDRPGFQTGVEVQAPLGDMLFFPYYKSSDFSWSPDSQWLAYWWETDGGQAYIGVADTSGHTRAMQRIGVTGNDPIVFYHGWSVDSQFLAVSSLNALDGQFMLSIWYAPGLQPIRTLHYSRTPSADLSRLTAPGQLAAWSTHGHQIAYLTSGDALQLAIAAPDAEPVTADLPAAVNHSGLANYELPYMSWAPDDQHIAILRPTDTSHRLDLVDTATSTALPISDRVVEMALLPDARYVRWSADGSALFYAQSTSDASLSDLSVFHVADRKTTTLISTVFNNAQMTPDDTYLLFKQQRADGLDAVLLNPDTGVTLHVAGLATDNATNPLFVLGQSNDGDWLALADDVAQSPFQQMRVVWAVNVASGADYPLPDAQSGFYGIGEPGFVSPDGHWLAAFLMDTSSAPTGIMVTALADGSTRTFPVAFPTGSLFLDLAWAKDSVHLAVRTNRNDPTTVPGLPDTATLIDVQTGVTRQFGPLLYYPSMSISGCQ